MTKKEWKRVCICIHPDEYKFLRIGAAELQISMSEYIRTLVKAHLIEIELRKEKATAKPS